MFGSLVPKGGFNGEFVPNNGYLRANGVFSGYLVPNKNYLRLNGGFQNDLVRNKIDKGVRQSPMRPRNA